MRTQWEMVIVNRNMGRGRKVWFESRAYLLKALSQLEEKLPGWELISHTA